MPVAITLAAALAGGWWFTRPAPAPVAPSPTPSAAPSPTQVDGTPIPSALELPGPGRVETVRKALVAKGFTCEREDQPGMDSWLCTHYRSQPAMMAYVGGATGRRLGRVALNVQVPTGQRNPTALALQEWLVQQVVADPGQRTSVLEQVRAGTDGDFALTAEGSVVARGTAEGSVVAFVNGWVPSAAQAAHLLPATPLAPALEGLGYRCTGGAGETTCTRSQQGLTHQLDYRTDGLAVGYLKLTTTGGKGSSPQAPAAAEVTRITSLFQQSKEIQRWLAGHRGSSTGATGYQGGLSLDWYPGPDPATAKAAGGSAVFYLRESCWTDSTEAC